MKEYTRYNMILSLIDAHIYLLQSLHINPNISIGIILHSTLDIMAPL